MQSAHEIADALWRNASWTEQHRIAEMSPEDVEKYVREVRPEFDWTMTDRVSRSLWNLANDDSDFGLDDYASWVIPEARF